MVTTPFSRCGSSDRNYTFCSRYLLVKGRELEYQGSKESQIPFVTLDNRHPTTMGNSSIQIPEPSYKIQKLLEARRMEFLEEDFDEDDQLVFNHVPESSSQSQRHHNQSQSQTTHAQSSSGSKKKTRPEDDWKHDPEYVRAAVEHLLPPPQESSTTAAMALQREMRAMVKEQDTAASFKELGWYMPPEFNEDNLFQWIVEMHSFDPEIPIAKDLAAKKLNSIIFEIRFPSTFPHAPPFFRILRPRFLPFIRGGGGHVTGGEFRVGWSLEFALGLYLFG